MSARRLTWPVVCVLVVVASRTFAYALVPQGTLALKLEGSLGGPRLVVLAASAPLVSIAFAAAIVWIASLAVRERHLLAGGPAPDPLRIGPLAAAAACLFVCSATLFALFESYMHWRAGLGFHGWHCLVGPVHRDALPFLGALSVVASAIVAAVRHLYAWMRRTLAQLAVHTSAMNVARRSDAVRRRVLAGRRVSAWNARGPPRAVCPY